MVYVVKKIAGLYGSGGCLGVPGGQEVSVGLNIYVITKGYMPLEKFNSQPSHHRLKCKTNNTFKILYMTRLISNVKYGPLKQSAPSAAL